MEDFPDYYGILGVPRHTKPGGIRRAYVRKAWRHHPDIRPDDPNAVAVMTSINVAYRTLSDPVRRAAYDAQSQARPVQARAANGGHSASCRVSRAGHPYHIKKEPGVLDTALALLVRLIRYAAASLP